MTNSSSKINRRSFLFLGGAALVKGLSLLDLPAVAQPVQISKSKIGSIGFYKVVVDLTDPKTFITMGLANNAAQANTNQRSNGNEEFTRMVARHKATVVANGTFFAKNSAPQALQQEWVKFQRLPKHK